MLLEKTPAYELKLSAVIILFFIRNRNKNNQISKLEPADGKSKTLSIADLELRRKEQGKSIIDRFRNNQHAIFKCHNKNEKSL